MSANPFESTHASRRRTVLIVAIVVGVSIVATILLIGRRPAPVADDHASHTAAPSTPREKTVMLSSESARRIGVTYATAVTGPVSREIRTVAQVTFDETRVRAISPRIDGWVENLYVNFTGQSVSQGQPLLAIYSPALVSAQQELLLAGRLSQSMTGASEEARQNSADLRAAARNRLRNWDISEDQVRRIEQTGNVQRTVTLRAPFGGVVVEKNVIQGQKIVAGDALYKVADLSTVWVEGEVFERDLPAIRLGAAVNVELEALPGDRRTGRITYIYPTLNTETRTARIRVAMANPGIRLKPGMYATILIGGAGIPALTVPRSAVLSTGNRSIVFVRAKNGDLTPREVQVGFSNNDRTQILSGLTAGETVVASATFLVDAESNLGAAMGGMGDMPGMDITTPPEKRK